MAERRIVLTYCRDDPHSLRQAQGFVVPHSIANDERLVEEIAVLERIACKRGGEEIRRDLRRVSRALRFAMWLVEGSGHIESMNA